MSVVQRNPGLTQQAKEILAGRGLSKRFGGIYAVNDVSLTCGAGEVVGLIGPNGAGKTTLMNIISGVIFPDEGEIHVDGTRVDSTPPERCARLGIARTFQNIRVFSKLTVRQNVQVAYTTAVRHRVVDPGIAAPEKIIALLGLTAFADKKSETLPYGTQRRVEIARALALSPRVLLLDEPAAGMNERESEDLLGTIREISERFGFGIVVIDHDLRFIMNVCHRIYVMHMGEIIAHDEPAAIRANPRVQEVYLGNRQRAGHGAK